MRKENQDNWSFLAEKLDAPESLPGERPLDKAAAWNGVQSRLRPAKKRAAFRWWATAALVILSLGATALLRTGLLRSSVSPTETGRQQPAPPHSVSRPVEKAEQKEIRLNDPSAVASARSAIVLPAFHPASPGKQKTRKTAAGKAKENGSAFSLVPEKKNNLMVDSAKLLLPASAFAENKSAADPRSGETAAVHRSLRVVHLNELDEPGFPDAAVSIPVRNQRTHLIRLLPLFRTEGGPGSNFKPATAVYTPLLRINLTGNE